MAKENNNINNLNIPKGWKHLPFGNVFEFIPTLSLSREQLTKDEETSESIYNIHYGDIHATYNANVLDFDKELRIPKIKDVADLKLNTLKEGDLAIADASEDYAGVAACIELVNVKKRTVTGGLHTFIARDNSGLTVQGFRTYVLKNPVVSIELKKVATGSKVYGISKTNLATLEILLPPTKEQTKIAQILSTWDASIETLQLLIAKKERRKKALMQKLLTGKIRFKEFRGEKWVTISLGQVVDFSNGKAHENLVVKDGEYILITSKFVSTDGQEYRSVSECLSPLIKNDVVMVMSDIPNGRALAKCFLVNENNKYALNQRIGLFRSNGSIDSLFLLYIINRHKYFLDFDSGVGQTNLRKEDILNCPLYIPKIKEQKKIAEVISAADEEIQTLKTSLAHYKQQKQGLMQVLLTGKKRVKTK